MSGTIAFVTSEISVGEADGQAVVTIGRTGDLSQPVTITYGLSPDSAIQGQDYLGTTGTVVMAAGQDRVTVNVPIVNDALSESTESFVASIFGVSSGSFGTPRTTRINILDDENPVTDPPVPPLASDYIVTETGVINGLNTPIDFAFSPTDPDIVFIAEKGGRIRVYDLDSESFLPDFVDLRGVANDWQDRGLMNIALHPEFPAEPYLYAYYVVDPPEAGGLSGNAGLDGGGNRYAYLSRFTADPSADGLRALPGSEVVLVGGAGTSYADVAGGGSVGANGTANLGLPASDRFLSPNDPTPPEVINGYKQDFIKVDSLTHAGGGMAFGPDGMLYVGIGDGTLPTVADPRTVSVQDLDSLAGKILRIDPITGEGLPDNPFAEPGGSLDANRAKVWQLGVRNPFSMGFNEDGLLFITDTGWSTYEEINQGGAGANFGWPFYEGGDFGELLRTAEYRDFPEAAAFYEAVANGEISITAAFRAFAHSNAAPGFQVQSIVGGDAFYDGTTYPAELRGDYFFIDFSQSEVFAVDVNDRRDVKFIYAPSDGSMPVYLTQGPDGFLWYADIAAGEIGRLIIEGRRVFVDLGAAQANYAGTHRPEIYVVDAASDSTLAQLDRITDLDVAAGDRVDFTGTGWSSGDLTFTRFNIGQPGEYTRVSGPNGFSLRIDERLPDLNGAFKFANPGNAAPTAVNDTAASTGAAVTVNVLANDADPNGGTLRIEGFDTISANGGTVKQTGNALVYTPAAGFFGTDTFTYALSDGDAIDIGTVTVTVTAAPRRIVNLTSAQATYAGTADADIFVVDSASDSTKTLLDRIQNLDVASGDRVDFTATGWEIDDLTFHKLAVGQPYEFTRIDGPNGFSLRIDKKFADLEGAFIFGTPPANRAPVAVDDVAATTGAPVTINVLGNDGDPDGDSLTVSTFDAISANGGTVARSGNALVYTPAAGFTGTDTFNYVASDGQATDAGKVTVTVSTTPPPTGNAVNLTSAQATYAGTAGADRYVVDAASDSTLSQLDRIENFDVAQGDRIDFTATGWDSDDFIYRRFGVGQPYEFTRLDGPNGFALRINEKLADLQGAFIFGVPADNRPPIAVNDVAATTGAPVSVSVLANDSDPDGDTLLIESFDATSVNGGTVARSGNSLVYTPAAGFTGADSFAYVLSDGEATDVGTVSVTVSTTPPPPTGNVVNLTSAQATYPGTSSADVYVVDSASDSTLAQLDRIENFDVAAGDRVDFTATGWDRDDFAFHRLGVGQPYEFTRLGGPDGFALRINEKLADLDGAFVFAGDAIL